MNKQQLSEKYYGILNEGFWDFMTGLFSSDPTSSNPTPSKPIPTTGGGGGGGQSINSNLQSFFEPSTESSRGSSRRDRGEEAREKYREKRKKIDSLYTRIKQEMSNMAKTSNITDTYKLRAMALDKLQQDKDFVQSANEVGETVGRYSGYGNRGRFSYDVNKDTEEEVKAASERSRKQLFDAQGRAKVFERNPKTGELEGRDPTDEEVAARTQRWETSQPEPKESRATYYGRLLQRGAKLTPTTLDQENYRAAAERDIEREGPLDRYKDRGEVMRGMEERGFDVGIGDNRALSGDSTRMYSPEYIKSIKQDLKFDPTGMTREEITKKALEIARKNTKSRFEAGIMSPPAPE